MSGGSGQQQTTTQVSKVELPPWVDKASQDNYAFAQQIAAKPLVQYQGPTVAGVAPAQQQSWDLASNLGSVGQPAYSAAQGALAAGAEGSAANYVTPGMLANTDLSPYMNPYEDKVIQNTLNDMNLARGQAIATNADKASSANAFGGSRQGITDAVTNAQSIIAQGKMSDQMRADNYAQAVTGATGDLNRQLQGALANQSDARAGNAQLLQAGQGLEASGNDAQRNALQQFMALTQSGGQQQAQQQAVLDANKAKFDEANNYDVNRLNILLSSLGMSPYGKTQTTQTTQNNPNGGTDWAQAGLGALSIAGSIFAASDRTIKKNITPVGVHGPTGLPMYSYRYKSDKPTAPKIVGPMAQDVKAKFGALAAPSIGGKLAINIPHLSVASGAGIGALGSLFPSPRKPKANKFAISPMGRGTKPIRPSSSLSLASPKGVTGALGMSPTAAPSLGALS